MPVTFCTTQSETAVPIHAIDANVRPSAAAGYTGWFGMDQFNNPTGNPYNGVSTDVIFEADEVIIPLDNGTALAQRGVYACKRDLSNFRRVWDGASGGQVLNQDLYSTAVCPLTGTAVMSVLIPGASVGVEDYKLDLFTSLFSSGYKEWTKVGRYELNTLVSTSRQFIGMRFRDNGDLILASANGAGKDAYSSAVCRISGAFDPLGDVECVHPVYWVDPIAGNDGNTGYTPTSMWKTVKYAITANRVPFGCLVSVGPGYSDEGTSTITPAWKRTPKSTCLRCRLSTNFGSGRSIGRGRAIGRPQENLGTGNRQPEHQDGRMGHATVKRRC